MSEKVVIKVNDNGSYRITGDVELVDAEGNVFETKKAFPYVGVGNRRRNRFVMEHIGK